MALTDTESHQDEEHQRHNGSGDAVSTFTRKELYRLVWSKPIIQVAKEIGVSDVAVAKRCRRNKIPVPGRGYWRKLETGAKLPKIPLPKWKGPDEIVFYPESNRTPAKLNPIGEELPAYVIFERAPENLVVVSDTLSRPHPLIKEAKSSLKKSNSDRKGEGFLFRTEPCLDIQVSGATRDRALCIMDVLIKALKLRGMLVEVTAKGGIAKTMVHQEENKLLLSLHEAFRHEPTGEMHISARVVHRKRRIAATDFGIARPPVSGAAMKSAGRWLLGLLRSGGRPR